MNESPLKNESPFENQSSFKSNSPFKIAIGAVKHWYIPLIIGMLLLVLGVIVFATPLAAYVTLTMLFSISFFVSGVLQISFSLANRKELDSWGWYLVGGILYTLFGVLLMASPALSMGTLAFAVGFFILFHSIHALGWAYDLKNMGILRWGNLAIAGALGIIFSFILLLNPLFAGFTLIVWTGISFIAAGVASIVLAFQLKRIKGLPSKIREELKSKIENLKREYYQLLH